MEVIIRSKRSETYGIARDTSDNRPHLRLHLNEPSAIAKSPGENYPETSLLKSALAKIHGISDKNILLTAGADQGLDIASRSIAPGSKAVILHPDYPRYQHHAMNARLDLALVQIGDFPFQFPTIELLNSIGKDTSIVILSTVSNPTGFSLPEGVIREVRRRSAGALIVIDEVYSAFTGDDYTEYAVSNSRTIALRSFSKIGFPGLRVGYIVGSESTLQVLEKFISPFALASESILRAMEALEKREGWKTTVKRQIEARKWLSKALTHRDLKTAAGEGNFLLVFLGDDAPHFVAELSDRRILVQLPTDSALRGWVRISTPDIEAMTILVKKIDEFLPDILFTQNASPIWKRTINFSTVAIHRR